MTYHFLNDIYEDWSLIQKGIVDILIQKNSKNGKEKSDHFGRNL